MVLNGPTSLPFLSRTTPGFGVGFCGWGRGGFGFSVPTMKI